MVLFKNKGSFLFISLTFCTLLLISACGGCQKKTQREYDATEINPVKILRFERELFETSQSDAPIRLKELHKKYHDFYFYYAQDMLAMPFSGDSLFTKPMGMLLDYKPFRILQHKVDSFFPDLNDVEEQLTDAMGIYKAQFPKATIPDFISFISEFGYANVTFNKQVGIGLDMYMKEVFSDYYRSLEFPEFMIAKLQRKFIVPNSIKALAISKYDDQLSRDKRFIAHMIFEGKVKYFTKALLPNTPDSTIMGYTPAQQKWVEENEAEMWAHYAEKDLLYKDQPNLFMRYLNDGPFTSADGVPQDSAPAIGVWTGWKIVQGYMNNTNTTLEELMNEKDFDKILKLSRYKPE